jgi:flavodoxin
MKTAVIYASVHHQNTKKLLEQAAAAFPMDILTVEEAKQTDLTQYDAVGIASGIYAGSAHKTILGFLQSKPAFPAKGFVVTTSGMGSQSYADKLAAAAWKAGLNTKGAYACRGLNTFGPFKIGGGMAKGHPNAEDVQGLVDFLKNIEKA